MKSRASLDDAYPLHWPDGHARTEPYLRKRSKFKCTLGRARDELLRELKLVGARYVVLSTNLQVKLDGLFYASQREPDDPGVAAYFDYEGAQHVLACDRWDLVRDNVVALAKTVEAMRGIERWGSSSMMKRAFSAFKALPAQGEAGKHRPWWEVLEVPPNATLAEARRAYRALAAEHHPDAGGTHERMAEINNAFHEAEAVVAT